MYDKTPTDLENKMSHLVEFYFGSDSWNSFCAEMHVLGVIPFVVELTKCPLPR